jgi:putative ABC transport system permease protein
MRVGDWARHLRQAIRLLTHTPGFTLMAITTLALAIGANAAIFSVVDKVLLDPLPYAHADRLVNILASAPGSDFPPEFGVSAEFFVQYHEQSKLLEDVSTYNSFTSTLRANDRVERIRMSAPTYSLFTTLGVQPILGRLPVADDEDRVVVISYALWQSWFGGSPDVLGRTYSVAGSDRTIVGVMGRDFRFPDDGTLLWMSTRIKPEQITPGRFGAPLVARLAPGATIDAATTELNTLASRLPARFGGSAAYARLISQHRAVVRPLRDEMLGPVARPLWVLLAAAGIVLLIACANVANLFLVRAEARQRDAAVRRAIGASRGHVAGLQLAEAFVVSAAAGVVAIALAYAALPVFVRAAPDGIPRLDRVGVSEWTFLFTFAAAILVGLGCGAAAAIRAANASFTRLRDGGRGATGRRSWIRDGLVVGQTALALELIIGSGLLVRSFAKLRHVDPGYSTTDLFTFQIAPEGPRLPDGPAYARFDLDFMRRLRALPGVETVGLVENIPLNESTASARVKPEGFAGDVESGPLVHVTFTAGDYFKAMGIPLLAGRLFDDNDHLSALPNVIVSQSVANTLWPGDTAIGKRLQREGLPDWFTVVGVVRDVMQDSFRDRPQPLVYFPLAGPKPMSWAISSPAYVVKTPRAETIAPDVRTLVREVAPEAPMYRVFTMAGLARDSMVQLSFTMLTLGVVSALALVLGTVGLYGVLSYLVAERTREIGVRMALGARSEQVSRMVMGQGARVVGIGVVVGLVAALLSTRALGTLLYEVHAIDAPTFAAAAVLMIVIGLLASYLPARRASQVDPMVSLRAE